MTSRKRPGAALMLGALTAFWGCTFEPAESLLPYGAIDVDGGFVYV